MRSVLSALCLLALVSAGCTSSTDDSSVPTTTGRQGSSSSTTVSTMPVASDSRPVLLMQREMGDDEYDFALVHAGDLPEDGLAVGRHGLAQAIVETDDGYVIAFRDAQATGPEAGATVVAVDRALSEVEVLDERPAYESYPVDDGLLVDCGMWVCRDPVLVASGEVAELSPFRDSSYRYEDGPLVAWERADSELDVVVDDLTSDERIEGQSPVIPFFVGLTPFAVVPLPEPNSLQIIDIRDGSAHGTLPGFRVTPTGYFEEGLVLFYSSCADSGCTAGSHVADLRGAEPEIIETPDGFYGSVLLGDELVGTTDSGAVTAVNLATGEARELLGPVEADFGPVDWNIARIGDSDDLVAWIVGNPTSGPATTVATGSLDGMEMVEVASSEYEGWLYAAGGEILLGTRQPEGFQVDRVEGAATEPIWGPASEIDLVGTHPQLGTVVFVRDGAEGRLQAASGASASVGAEVVCYEGYPIDQSSMMVLVSDEEDGCYTDLSLLRVDFAAGSAERFADGWDLPWFYRFDDQRDAQLLESWPPLIADDWPEEPWEPYYPGHPYEDLWRPDLED